MITVTPYVKTLQEVEEILAHVSKLPIQNKIFFFKYI